uniref:Uncharacterized protein n=1 Tax=Anolis carolinensis TaxID=28377 RepID=A0A803TDR9_ANOCA
MDAQAQPSPFSCLRERNQILLRRPSVQTTCSGQCCCTVVCTLVRLGKETQRDELLKMSERRLACVLDCLSPFACDVVWHFIHNQISVDIGRSLQPPFPICSFGLFKFGEQIIGFNLIYLVYSIEELAKSENI